MYKQISSKAIEHKAIEHKAIEHAVDYYDGFELGDCSSFIINHELPTKDSSWWEVEVSNEYGDSMDVFVWRDERGLHADANMV